MNKNLLLSIAILIPFNIIIKIKERALFLKIKLNTINKIEIKTKYKITKILVINTYDRGVKLSVTSLIVSSAKARFTLFELVEKKYSLHELLKLIKLPISIDIIFIAIRNIIEKIKAVSIFAIYISCLEANLILK
ncbi:hypothetical protein ABE450_001526 [Clostridium perfringens]|uniref:hypothetical protein n=2 Tax=Clostridium perfringens TaxID=1502 RepID=UPI0013E29854|nr:hypothetical protein [Clostridium perfringens]EJT5917046.1 hypothetical protein [Clostridium perfringens]EJT5939587.1 hypothetical protein [Clostridium perfringens]EJT6135718.1 hypothetical protein [Clostridium perfringens]EJT6150972.1 hypothetical protein [Clostridium perfringens]EJT6471677.1 hypothetical protein [Clostridium perfringens]